MKPGTEHRCLGCGALLPNNPAPAYENDYAVCISCADILREDFHIKHAQVVKDVCRGLDSLHITPPHR